MSSDSRCASPPNGRRAKDEQHAPGHPAHGERRKKGNNGRWAGLQRERPQARSIQLQRGPPTTKGRTTRQLCLRPQESGEKEHSGGAAPPGKQGRGKSKASTQRGTRKGRRARGLKLECSGLSWSGLGCELSGRAGLRAKRVGWVDLELSEVEWS